MVRGPGFHGWPVWGRDEEECPWAVRGLPRPPTSADHHHEPKHSHGSRGPGEYGLQVLANNLYKAFIKTILTSFLALETNYDTKWFFCSVEEYLRFILGQLFSENFTCWWVMSCTKEVTVFIWKWGLNMLYIVFIYVLFCLFVLWNCLIFLKQCVL